MNKGGWDRFKSDRGKVSQTEENKSIYILTVYPPSVWYETKRLKLIHEILKCSIHDIEELRLDETLNNPKAIPVVLFTKSATCMRRCCQFIFEQFTMKKKIPGTTNV